MTKLAQKINELKQMQKKFQMLITAPLALAPKNQSKLTRTLPKPMTPAPAKASPPIPRLPNGKIDSLAITRQRQRQKEADAKAASLAISAKKPAGKIILNKSKYSL